MMTVTGIFISSPDVDVLPPNHHLAPMEARWPHLAPPPDAMETSPTPVCLTPIRIFLPDSQTLGRDRAVCRKEGRRASVGATRYPRPRHTCYRKQTWAPLRAHLAHPIRQGPVPPPLPSTTVMTTTVAAAFTEHLLYTRHSAETEH